ncbi:MAG: hypothetical protein DMG60_13375 [Acidobacteria bacterium]|nr:MAG: hypothetical protein DMG60_13375 [Acidobacteriota bacterium]
MSRGEANVDAVDEVNHKQNKNEGMIRVHTLCVALLSNSNGASAGVAAMPPPVHVFERVSERYLFVRGNLRRHHRPDRISEGSIVSQKVHVRHHTVERILSQEASLFGLFFLLRTVELKPGRILRRTNP